MQNFHDNKLWQESFVSLMDILDVVDGLGDDARQEIIIGLIAAAKDVTAKIADGLSRNDHRLGKNLIHDAVGLVAITRTELAIAWGRRLLPDDTFKALDDKYAKLTDALQRYK